MNNDLITNTKKYVENFKMAFLSGASQVLIIDRHNNNSYLFRSVNFTI